MVVRILLITLCLTAVAHASPVEDLASPSQATRDAAAAALRVSYKPLPRAPWVGKFGNVKPGTPKKSIVDQLTPEQARALAATAADGATVAEYRLDDTWILLCIYKAAVETVIRCRVSEVPRHVLVNPPRGYTGPWTDYFVTGQRAREASYRDGVLVGTSTSYHPNGQKALVETFGPDGHVQGSVWYNQAGVVTRRYGKPAGG
jgi:hypothetical protein